MNDRMVQVGKYFRNGLYFAYDFPSLARHTWEGSVALAEESHFR